MKRFLKHLMSVLLPAVLIFNRAVRAAAAAGHHLQYLLQWRFAPRSPDSFDQFIDQYWKWNITRNPMSWERGIFGLLAMKPGCRLLDLCCGEGFYSHRFYSGRAGSIIAMDYNPAAITHARRNFPAPNIDYRCGDIRTQMPDGPFDNISWDAAIEYFTPQEIDGILDGIKARLAPCGILHGYSLLAGKNASGDHSHESHKYAASSRDELGRLLGRFFRNVTILRTAHADQFIERTNHYFFASNGPVPFGEDWPDLERWKA